MIRKKSIRKKLAVLLVMVFISTLLVKPLHVFLPCHDSCVSENINQTDTASSKHKDCGICHFSFSIFTAPDLASLHLSSDLLLAEITECENNSLILQPDAKPSLRAPPAL